jgi:N-acetylglutamate synthase-like GNAT family acetyltransferase
VPFRPAQPSDGPAITTLINLAFQVERFFIDTDRITLSEVLDHFERGEFLLAEENGALVGCVYLEPRGERTYLGLLSIDPSRQGSGLGSQLMTAAEERCRGKGVLFLDLLIVNLREELPAFYRKRGYQETGVAPFPTDVETKLPCHFVSMSKRL